MKKTFIGGVLLALLCCFGLLIAPELTTAATNGAVAEKTYKNHKYALYEDATSWKDAKEKCEKLGGHLVTITSSGENKVAYNLFSKSKYAEAAIGLYNAGSVKKPKWKWVTGEKVSYKNWAPYEPNYGFSGGEKYAGFYQKTNQWNDFRNERLIAYICEWDYTLKLSETKLSLDINDATYIDYTIKGTKPKDKKISFKSSDTKIVKVSSKGKVVAKQAGVAKITVTYGHDQKTITVTVCPGKVSKLKAASTMKRSIKLSWKKQSGVSRYQVYMYDTDLEEYVKVKTVSSDFATATISGLSKNTTYKFKVRAGVKSGSKYVYGEFSNILETKTKK